MKTTLAISIFAVTFCCFVTVYADELEDAYEEYAKISANYSLESGAIASAFKEGRISQAEYSRRIQILGAAFAASNALFRSKIQKAMANRNRSYQANIERFRNRFVENDNEPDRSSPSIPDDELVEAVRERRVLDIGRWIEEGKTTADAVERAQNAIASEKTETEIMAALRDNRLADIALWIQKKETTAASVEKAKKKLDLLQRTQAEAVPKSNGEALEFTRRQSNSASPPNVTEEQIKAAVRNGDEDLLRQWVQSKAVTKKEILFARESAAREKRAEEAAENRKAAEEMENRRKELLARYDAELRSDFKKLTSVSELTLEEALLSGTKHLVPGTGYWGGTRECLVQVNRESINRTFNGRKFYPESCFASLTKTLSAELRVNSDPVDRYTKNIRIPLLICPLKPFAFAHGPYLHAGLFVYDGTVRPPDDPVDVVMDVNPENVGLRPGGHPQFVRPIAHVPDVIQFHEIEIPESLRYSASPPPEATRHGDCRTVQLPNGESIDMIWCSPGEFRMGNPATISGQSSYERFHKVTLTHGFWLAKTELTRGQWRAVMGDEEERFADARMIGGSSGADFDAFLHSLKDNEPRTGISWNDCQRFLHKLNETNPGLRFRLPTEAEWEYACRAGDTTGKAPANVDELAWHSEIEYDGARGVFLYFHPVAQKKPNPWGFSDMLGNVAEFCQDWFGEYTADQSSDPSGPLSGARKVLRGGSNINHPIQPSGFSGTPIAYFSREQSDPRSCDRHSGVRLAADFCDIDK